MSMPERYHPECPPDAHKVIRPPLKEVHALLCVKVNDTEEANGMDNVCDILSLMNKKPFIVCSEKMKELIKASAAQAEIEPEFVVVHENNKASISYADGSVSNTFDYYDFADIQKDSIDQYDFLLFGYRNGVIGYDFSNMSYELYTIEQDTFDNLSLCARKLVEG